MLPPFRTEIGAEGDGAQADRGGARRGDAQDRGRPEDLRRRPARRRRTCRPASPISPQRHAGLALLSIGLPRVHEIPGGGGIYPQLFHELAVATFDALLKAACAFMAETGLEPPRHYRGLGRSAFVDAAKKADAGLDRICRHFDFLLSVSPINTSQAFEQFRDDKWVKPPAFRYRPLTVDPSEAKKALYRIDLKAVEDPVLETLFSEKRQEIDHQLTMLDARNTPRFPFASLMLYEPVESAPARDRAADPRRRCRRPAGAGRHRRLPRTSPMPRRRWRSAMRRAIRRSRSMSSCATTSPPA